MGKRKIGFVAVALAAVFSVLVACGCATVSKDGQGSTTQPSTQPSVAENVAGAAHSVQDAANTVASVAAVVPGGQGVAAIAGAVGLLAGIIGTLIVKKPPTSVQEAVQEGAQAVSDLAPIAKVIVPQYTKQIDAADKIADSVTAASVNANKVE